MKTIIESYLEKNNISLNILLKNVFNLKIINVTFLGKCILKGMPEYNFGLLKYNVVLEDYSNYTIFIKLINKEKIEESLFCYWFFCEEYFGLKNRHYTSKANIINLKKNNYETQFSMEIFNKHNILWKKSFVDIIDLKKYCMNKSIKKNNELNKINKSMLIAVI